MRASYSDRVERARVLPSAHDTMGTEPGTPWGCFTLRTNAGVSLMCIVSPADPDDSSTEALAWDHVSVSTRGRCPTWEEMCWVKSLFWGDDEVVIQYHPAKSDYVNFHPYCLHLWRPAGTELPKPPAEAVGPRAEAAS